MIDDEAMQDGVVTSSLAAVEVTLLITRPDYPAACELQIKICRNENRKIVILHANIRRIL